MRRGGPWGGGRIPRMQAHFIAVEAKEACLPEAGRTPVRRSIGRPQILASPPLLTLALEAWEQEDPSL
jgi:hypothetical protein